MATTPSIPGAEVVLSALGWWPAFHDAEVVHFSHSRGATPEEKKSEARLDVQIREYRSRNEGSGQHERARVKNVIIEFSLSAKLWTQENAGALSLTATAEFA